MANQVLIGGEKYSELISKRLGGSPNEPAISYLQARDKLLSQIQSTRTELHQLPHQLRLPTEFVVCIRMNPKYSAKSYFPKGIIKASLNEVDPIGSRNWYSDDEVKTPGKLIFARTTDTGLYRL